MAELRRALGRWDLTAVGVNQVIGAAIFLLPAQVATEIGAWSPLGFVAIGLASLAIALCFAEVGSRFDGTGGPYLFTRTAFGPFVAFERHAVPAPSVPRHRDQNTSKLKRAVAWTNRRGRAPT